MAATVPCRHNTLSQTVDGRRTGWPPVETFLKALRAAAAPGAVPADAEARARMLWEQSRRQVPDRARRPRVAPGDNGSAAPTGTDQPLLPGPAAAHTAPTAPALTAGVAPATAAGSAPVPGAGVAPISGVGAGTQGPQSVPAGSADVPAGAVAEPPTGAQGVSAGSNRPPTAGSPQSGHAGPVEPASDVEPDAPAEAGADDGDAARDDPGRLRRLLRVLRRR
jgi:hypothetical protein